MKIVSTLLVTLMISAANAQSTETVNYEVNTHDLIRSLRLSAVDENVNTSLAIGEVSDSSVCLNLNPELDYELLVNNTRLIRITSRELREALPAENTSSPVSLFSMKSWDGIEE
ncbi:MAG: hypothetical protein NXI10_01310 [bacterium]|nr:hypothetical protein [bacterium]